MAKYKISFSDNVIPINQIDNQQRKKIQKLYEDAVKDVNKQIQNLQLLEKQNASTKLQIYRLNQLKDSLNENLKEVTREVEKEIKANMQSISEMTIEKYAEYLGNQQISLKVSYAHISNDIINNITSGNLYKDQYGADWNFSKRIWGDYNSAKGELASIVTNGMLSGKGCYEIAKDLEKYVMPNAQKPWDWSRVYPGTRKKIDYNAQRLARTMISHAYQQSLVEMSKNNPFASGIEWRSALIEHRTCELCEQRHGQIFPVNQLPLDHPNGLCTYLMVFNKSKKEIADDLVNWVNGEENPELDKYATYLTGEDFSKLSKMQKMQNMKISEEKKKEINSNIVNGKDISETFTRNPEYDFIIDDVIHQQGFDGLPRIVNSKEFDKLVKEANNGNGFIAQRVYSAKDYETLNMYRDSLYHGKWYVDCSNGGVAYGRGMYCAADYHGILSNDIRRAMKGYAHNKSYIETLTLDKSAKIIDYQEISDKYYGRLSKMEVEKAEEIGLQEALKHAKNKDEKLMFTYCYGGRISDWNALNKAMKDIPKERQDEINEIADKIYDKVSLKLQKREQEFFEKSQKAQEKYKDIGAYAASLGYDAIDAKGAGGDCSYTVILNRTKLIIKEPK